MFKSSYKGVDKKTIESVRDIAYNEMKRDSLGLGVHIFDRKAVERAGISTLSDVQRELEVVKLRYKENFELYVICEMALLYLEQLKKEKMEDDLK